MPRLDYSDPAVWASTYKLKKASDPEVWATGYERDCSMFPAAVEAAAQIITVLGINASHRIGIIGAGYGWIANQIAQQSGCVVAAVDTSGVIQSGKAVNADIEILNIDVSGNNGRNQVRQALGLSGQNKASFVITEEVITILDDAEAQQLSTFLHNLSDNVVHWTTVRNDKKLADGNQDPRFNWHSIAEWKALLPGDLFIVAGTAVLA